MSERNIGRDLAKTVDKVSEALKSKRKALFVAADGKELVPVAVLGLTRLYAVDKDGVVSANDLGMDYDKFRHPALDKPVTVEPITLSTGGRDLYLGEGAGVILGEPDTGKSLFADTLHDRNPGLVKVIRFREPEIDSLLYESECVKELVAAITSNVRVIIVDSIRTTFYSSTGTTGKGGVNMGIFGLLTAYDILARRAGKIVLFALNPLTNDKDAIEFYLDAARGSVAHTIHTKAPKNIRISTRSGKTRDWFDHKYEPAKTKGATRKAAESQHGFVVPSTNEDSIADLYTVTK